VVASTHCTRERFVGAGALAVCVPVTLCRQRIDGDEEFVSRMLHGLVAAHRPTLALEHCSNRRRERERDTRLASDQSAAAVD
jgi:hypothetical protein